MAEAEESLELTVKKKPFLLKVVSIFILVEGAVGFLFFTAILLYQLINPDFLSGWGYGQFSGTGLLLILAVFSLAHLGLILSAFLLLKQHKKGIYIFFISLVTLIFSSFFIHSDINWVGISTGIFIMFILLLHWRSLY